MIRYILLFVSTFIIFSCSTPEKKDKVQPLNLELSAEIDKMAKVDLQMQLNVLKFSEDETQSAKIESIRKDVYEKHALRVSEILSEYGYPSYEIVGKQSTDNFYTLIRHARKFPEIQKEAIDLMKEKVDKKQVERYQYIDLSDQYASNNNLPQPFGTLVNYYEDGKAYIKNPSDEIETNRANFELDSLNTYLNKMTIQYFNNNQAILKEKGITEPLLN